MRVGAYIDAYNLYYGMRAHCGRGTAGWRWLDVRGLLTTLVSERLNWTNASLSRVVYCTAAISSRDCSRDAAADRPHDLRDVLGAGCRRQRSTERVKPTEHLSGRELCDHVRGLWCGCMRICR